ncbi:MAG: hypothetical protein EXX96DRAFT_473668 [Benjaminiella poitrasii]|nr:MAG: hypothetical protein EXX96DRAFT_473668 [Benjaminiella poitrasii]
MKSSESSTRKKSKLLPPGNELGDNNNKEEKDIKKKKSKSSKKNATQKESDKKGIVTDASKLLNDSARKKSKSSGSSSSSNTADQQKTTEGTNKESSKTKKRSTKDKSSSKKESSTEPINNRNTNQETYTVDYEGLKDALRGSFSLHDRYDSIRFAPLVSKTKKGSQPLPATSASASASASMSKNKSSRTSNTSSPSAKNRHAEIPPPPNLTTDSAHKKKRSTKLANSEEKKTLANKKNITLKQEQTNGKKKSPETIDKKKNTLTLGEPVKPVVFEKKGNRRKNSDKKVLGEPVKPVVFVKEEKKKATIVSAKKTSEVTNDERKREIKEIKEGMKMIDQTDYCHPNDIIHGTRSSRIRYDRYVDPRICQEKLKQGVYYQGVLRINKRSRSDAYVTCDNLDSDIFINGQRDRNRALDGDSVIVELLDLETVWSKKKESMIQKREQRHSTAVERPPREEDEDDKGKPKYVGKVVSIAKPGSNQNCSGTLTIHRNSPTELVSPENDSLPISTEGDYNSADDVAIVPTKNNKDVRLVWFKPVDKRRPLIAIQLRYAPSDILTKEEKYKSLLMVAKIIRWPIDSLHPFGAVIRELGHIGNIPAETQAVLEDNGIEEKPFGKKALKGLPKLPWSIPQSELDKRRDLRETRIFTIDPSTAKDLDDAVHVTKLDDDQFEVGVHIADVSHFVHPHTALDHEAFDRGTSTYLCDRVIPMLPSLLCEELCSLNPGVERLAFSVIWKMDSKGNINDTWFGKTVIKSCAKLAYDDAQQVIEGNGLPESASIKFFSVPEVEQDIVYLFNISKHMRERRFANGALSMNSIRLSFKLNELGEPCGVSIYEQKDANRLIEEFMLCANMSVAQKIIKHYPNEALLRQHSPPHEKTLNEFIKIAESWGYTFDGSSAGSLQESFNAIESEEVRAVLRLVAIKPMQRAKYFCTGVYDASHYRHYALNVPLYTHFTSPIRRFADIIVHRQLEAALSDKSSCGYKKNAVQKAAGHCNERKEAAKNAQDMNIQLYLAHYLHMLEVETEKPIVCTAIVTQVLKDAFDILVPEYGLEKRIHVDSLPIEKFVVDAQKNHLFIYWKEGVEANWEWDENRRLDESYIEPSGKLLDHETVSDIIEVDNDESVASKKSVKVPDELLSDNLIDDETKMQRFEPLSKLTVRIQVNVDRSPPVINIYPVNPFM